MTVPRRPFPILDARDGAWQLARAEFLLGPTLPQSCADVPSPRGAVEPAPRVAAYEDPFLAANAARLDAGGDGRLSFDEDRWSLPSAEREVFLDIESFRNFAVVCMKRPDGRHAAFELSERCPLDRDGLRSALRGAAIVTFNGRKYDIPILQMMLRGEGTSRLKDASDRIIRGNMMPWDVEREFDVRPPRDLDHVDLSELTIRTSLKMLHGRLHGRMIVDLPFDPDKVLTPREMNVATLYCMCDLEATEAVWRGHADRLALREELGAVYKIDLRSKSDAQMGEAIVRRHIEDTIGRRITRPEPHTTTWRYEVPPFIRFENEALRGVAARFADHDFFADMAGEVAPPTFLKDLVVEVAGSRYNMGIGGLHSREANRSLKSDDDHQLIDVDVSSQYPMIIANSGICPPSAGPAFTAVYKKLIVERLEAKAKGDKTKAEGLKIALNGGVFGKSGNSYSIFFAPDLMIYTTLTGQLSVLMLIERAEAAGIPVVSANTDGVVFRCPRPLLGTLDGIVAAWEADTGFQIERTPYRAIYNSSVNTYFAVKEDGKVKRKGPVADPWSEGDTRSMMAKNPQMTVLGLAVERLILDGAPVGETVRACTDPRMFVTLIRVSGGAVWRGHQLGRAVRYCWSRSGESIRAAGSGNRVPKTEGARPLMLLPDEMPPDLDLDRYVREAEALAVDYAVTPPKGATVDLLARVV